MGAPVFEELLDESDSTIFDRDDDELPFRVMVKSGLLVSTVLRDDDDDDEPFDFDDDDEELDDFRVSDLSTSRS